MINLNQMPDGSWRLAYSEGVIPDISKASGFTIVEGPKSDEGPEDRSPRPSGSPDQ